MPTPICAAGWTNRGRRKGCLNFSVENQKQLKKRSVSLLYVHFSGCRFQSVFGHKRAETELRDAQHDICILKCYGWSISSRHRATLPQFLSCFCSQNKCIPSLFSLPGSVPAGCSFSLKAQLHSTLNYHWSLNLCLAQHIHPAHWLLFFNHSTLIYKKDWQLSNCAYSQCQACN